MTRYLLRCHRDGGVEVYDGDTGDANDGKTVFGPASWETASRKAHELNGYSFMSQSPATLCPNCAKYRRVLQEIARLRAAQPVPGGNHMERARLLCEQLGWAANAGRKTHETIAAALADAEADGAAKEREVCAEIADLFVENEEFERDIHLEANNPAGALTRARQAQTASAIAQRMRARSHKEPNT